MTYFKEIVFTGIVCGILTKLTMSSKEGSAKYVKYAASLIFIFVLVTPLVGKGGVSEDIFNDLAKIAGDNGTTDNHMIEKSQLELVTEEICKAAAEKGADTFDIPTNSFAFKIAIGKTEDNNIIIKNASVYCSSDKVIKSDLEHYFSNLLNCPTEVILNE